MHTPGPWSHEYTVNPLPGYDISGPNREPIAGICDVGDLPLEANARLIASAPKLLEALEEIARREGAYNRDPRIHAENTIDNMERVARAAIAEAKGE